MEGWGSYQGWLLIGIESASKRTIAVMKNIGFAINLSFLRP